MLPKAKDTNVVDFPKYNREQIELIKKTVARGATDDELALFLYRAKQLDLDPLSNQIYFVKRKVRNNRGGYDEIATIQVGIEGLRLIAERSGRYEGQDPIKYIVERNGQIIETEWVLPTDKPIAAKSAVYKKGCVKPFTAVAHYNDYVIKNSDGSPNAMWRRWTIMLAKCAESLALRKAFPELNFSDIYEPAESHHVETAATIEAEPFEGVLSEVEPLDVGQDTTSLSDTEEKSNNISDVIETPIIETEKEKQGKEIKQEPKVEKEIQKPTTKTESKSSAKLFGKEKNNAPDASEIFGTESNDPINTITDSQVNAILSLAKMHGLDEKVVRNRIKGISYNEAGEIIRQLGKKDLSYFVEPF